jgi:hypothetical protein
MSIVDRDHDFNRREGRAQGSRLKFQHKSKCWVEDLDLAPVAD